MSTRKDSVSPNLAQSTSAFVPRALLVLISASILLGNCTEALGAEDLSLRPGLSFNQDLDNGFPIVGKDLEDTQVSTSSPTFVFFGAAGDLNTNRQAKRVVDWYHKLAANTVKFIIIDVDHPANDGARSLIKSYYKGYIPTELLLDKSGKLSWSQTGETDLSALKAHIE